MTAEELKTIKMAVYYELQIILRNGEKQEYTVDELISLMEKIAIAKEQEK